MNIAAIFIIILFSIAIEESQSIFLYDIPESAVIFENDEVILHNDKINYGVLNSKPKFVQVTGSYLDMEKYHSILIVVGNSEEGSFEVIYCVLNLKGKDLKEGVFLNQVKQENIYIDYIVPSEYLIFNSNYDDQSMYVIYSPHSNPIQKSTLENTPTTKFNLDDSDSELLQFSKKNKILQFDVLNPDMEKYYYMTVRLIWSKPMLNDIVRKEFFSTLVKRESTTKSN
ncbi:uncharacterized protein LOC142317313 [Lycorma delicatula]|uniref:uncharacterized protein LOC142317313 n=1 Tax=Lycorma delicatula TaxID=130591 RepID=UPI003F50D8BF